MNDWANSAEGENGEDGGWRLRNSNKAARIPENILKQLMTNRAMEFIEDSKDKPGFYIYLINYWPYMAPAPYHNMYSANEFYPVHRNDSERKNDHPVYKRLRKIVFQNFFQR